MENKTKPDMQNVLTAMNKVIAGMMSNVKYKGTSYWYTKGTVRSKSAQYTRAKTSYDGRWGFWSWVATRYKNGTIKRTRFAKSGSRAKAEARAERLLENLKGGIKQNGNRTQNTA